MTSEAADVGADPNIASPDLVALVAKREAEMRAKDAPPAAATSANGKVTDPGASDVGQAEEVEASSTEGEDAAPEKGKPAPARKAVDVEWAKSDTQKGRLTALYEAGHIDDDLLSTIKDGFQAREIRKGAYEKFEAAADKVKAAEARAAAAEERASRYDRLFENPRFNAALNASEGESAGDDSPYATPEEKRIASVEKELKALREERRQAAASQEAQVKRVREIEGWAEDHKTSFNGTVSDEEYEGALKTVLTEMLEDEENPRDVLTQRGLVRKVNRVLERQREEREVSRLRESAGESKREAVRSARASSPAGVRTGVEKQYATPQAKRIAETLMRYPLRPD